MRSVLRVSVLAGLAALMLSQLSACPQAAACREDAGSLDCPNGYYCNGGVCAAGDGGPGASSSFLVSSGPSGSSSSGASSGQSVSGLSSSRMGSSSSAAPQNEYTRRLLVPGNVTAARISPNGDYAVYIQSGQITRLDLRSPDAGGVPVVPAESGALGAIAINDSGQVAFAQMVGSNSQVFRWTGSDPLRMVSALDGGPAAGQSTSPYIDGEGQVLFVSNANLGEPGTAGSHVWLLGTNGFLNNLNPNFVAPNRTLVTPLAVELDGNNKVLFAYVGAANSQTGQKGQVVPLGLQAVGVAATAFMGNDVVEHVAVSPNGDWLAVSARATQAGQALPNVDVFRYRLSTGTAIEETRVTTTETAGDPAKVACAVSNAGDILVWSKDREFVLVYTGTRYEPLILPAVDGGTLAAAAPHMDADGCRVVVPATNGLHLFERPVCP